MRQLPKRLNLEVSGRRLTVVHGGVCQLNRFIFSSTALAVKREKLKHADCDILIGGHSGLPWGQKIDHRAWLNAGVIGLPANGGTADGWYLLFTPQNDGIHGNWHRLNYAADLTSRNMTKAGLRSGYAEALTTGLWLSMDVFPELERQHRGQAIQIDEMIL